MSRIPGMSVMNDLPIGPQQELRSEDDQKMPEADQAREDSVELNLNLGFGEIPVMSQTRSSDCHDR